MGVEVVGRNRMHRCRSLFVGAWSLVLLTTVSGFAADAVSEAKARLLGDAKLLADDSWDGRGVGTKGLELAAEYIREQFKAAGLDVSVGPGAGLQAFPLITSAKLGDANSLTLQGPEGKSVSFQLDSDFEICSFGGSGKYAGGVIFCGYGIDDPDSKYNDFAGVDVKGQVVVLMRRNPGQSDPHGPFATGHGISRHAELRTKVSQAMQHGAAAVLIVNDPYSVRDAAKNREEGLRTAQGEIATLADAYLSQSDADASKVQEAREKLKAAVERWKSLQQAAKDAKNDALMDFGYAGHNENPHVIPVVHITQAKCNELLQAALGRSLADLETAIDADMQPKSAVLTGWTATGETSVEQVKSQVANVIGVLEGEGPHRDETIVIGAHYDHVGRGGANSLSPGSTDVHNGADDNASGTAALLELARRLGSRSQKLPRRVVFIAFTGEELGLLGSARYVKEPLFPLDQTIAMFNMDMVGRLVDDKLTVFGSGTSSRWEPELNALNEAAGFKFSYKPEGFGPSDHSSFYGKKIPVLHFFTGNHPDYHRPSDDWDKLNIDGMYRVVELLERLTIETAENPERPSYVEVKQAPMAQRGGNRPYFGTIPDFGGEGEGYAISGSAPGSPADKGGLQGGDRIVELGGNKIASLDDFDLALRKFKAGEEIDVVVLRKDERVTLKVKLEPPR